MKKTVFVMMALSFTGFMISCTKPAPVYLLNFKPEISSQWLDVAREFEKETGVAMKVVTAASNTYEQTLRSEFAKSAPPTLFNVNGIVGYHNYKDYTLDLKDSEIYDLLIEKDMAIKEDDGVFGIPYAIESYGIIYNDALLSKYFELAGRADTGANNASEINNFAKLKAVAEDIQKHAEDLGVKGAFASTSFAVGDDWRWQTHLANVPVFYEYRDRRVSDADDLELVYSDNYKQIFDLYLNNSVTSRNMVGSKTVPDSMSEFALGEVVFVQNGIWAWPQISSEQGNIVKSEDIKFLPIYIGVSGEENQGLCTGTENFICVNKQAAADKQEASLKFLSWLFNSPTGKQLAFQKLGFVTPFSSFSSEERPDDPLVREMYRYIDNGTYSINWVFTTFPSQQFKNDLGAALLDYAVEKTEWDSVKNLFVTKWAEEKALLSK
ncbi:MAG: ABC transporter substrate-binding protein [Spirochaetaceae bacterium]|jgi:raffinose/stachyose/melibiose transport system substrate-binding protein|nr:ABC transporter substrate-binding protein [Spirochaetaceae bacterium]